MQPILTARAPAPAFHLARPRRERIAVAVFMLLAALFLFGDLAPDPIALWDESRNIINALEMRRTGLSLVTTFQFEPDLWNTKPPLLIWLMAGSVALFGPTETALRLPSAVAALATLLVVIAWTRRATGSLPAALGAAAILVLSPGFFAVHGARTADYDALLVFCTTTYLALLYFEILKRRPSAKLLAAAGLAVAAAVMTKSIAGLLPGLGVALFMLLTRRLPRLWANRAYLLMALVAALPPLLFFALREAAAPGYLAAVLSNDTVGRFIDSQVGRYEPAWFYLNDALKGWFFAGPLLLFAPYGWRSLPARGRFLVGYCLCTALALLVLLSLASTKLTHYLLSAYPLLAVAAAILLRSAWHRLWNRAGDERTRLLLAFAVAVPLALLAARAGYWRYVSLPALQRSQEGAYSRLFASLAAQGEPGVTVSEPGFLLAPWPNYAPILRSYQLLWAERGFAVVRGDRGPLVASCDPLTAGRLARIGPDVGHVPGCIAVRSR